MLASLPPWMRSLLAGLVVAVLPGLGKAQDLVLSPQHTFRAAEGPTAVTFSSDGTILASGDDEGRIMGWSVEGKRKILQLRVEDEIQFLEFAAGDSMLVAVDEEGRVSVVAVAKETSQESSRPDVRFRLEDEPHAVAMDAGRRYLAAATDETVWLFDLEAGTAMGQIEAEDALDNLLFLGFDRLGRQLVAISERGTVYTWNPKTQRQIRKLTLSGGELNNSETVIQAVATDRGSSVFVVGLQEVTLPKGGVRRRARPGDLVRQNMIKAYDWDTGLEIKRVEYPEGPVQRLALGPGSDHVVTIPEDGDRVSVVDLSRGETVSTVPIESSSSALAISEGDQWIGVGTEEGEVVVWKIERRGQPTVADQEANLPSLSGRIRVLSEKAPAIPADTSAQLAILPFQSKGESTKLADVCSSALASQLANVEHLTLLERERIDEVLSELNLQASDLTESDGARIGHLLSADYLIMGSLNAVGNTYLLNAQLLQVQTAQITAGRRVICEECRGKDIFDAIDLLGSSIAE